MGVSSSTPAHSPEAKSVGPQKRRIPDWNDKDQHHDQNVSSHYWLTQISFNFSSENLLVKYQNDSLAWVWTDWNFVLTLHKWTLLTWQNAWVKAKDNILSWRCEGGVPIHLHPCELSRIIQELLGYRTNLPFSRIWVTKSPGFKWKF